MVDMGWGQSGRERDTTAMRLARSKGIEEGAVLVGVILGHRYSRTADCAESSYLGMIRCTQRLWIRERLFREELHWVRGRMYNV
jgi:hypothetical protein